MRQHAMIQTSRRGFLGLLGATLSAPLIVRATSLMPVKVPPLVTEMSPATRALAASMIQTKEIVARNTLNSAAIREALMPGLEAIFADAYKDIDFSEFA